MQKALGRTWAWFSSIFTVVGATTLLLYVAPIPFFDPNSATLMLESETAQVAVAKALSVAIGSPTAELNTFQIERFLFKDGTSVDWLRYPSGDLLYQPTSLKSITLGFFSAQSPLDLAENIRRSLALDGFSTQILTRPDRSLPEEAVILLLSPAFQNNNGAGFGVLIRKHALKIGGPRPTHFSGWSK